LSITNRSKRLLISFSVQRFRIATHRLFHLRYVQSILILRVPRRLNNSSATAAVSLYNFSKDSMLPLFFPLLVLEYIDFFSFFRNITRSVVINIISSLITNFPTEDEYSSRALESSRPPKSTNYIIFPASESADNGSIIYSL
jgi:hypothetical protein